MSNRKITFAQKPKIETIGKQLTEDAEEEIVVKLSAPVAKLGQTRAESDDIKAGSNPLLQETDEPKRIDQELRGDNEKSRRTTQEMPQRQEIDVASALPKQREMPKRKVEIRATRVLQPIGAQLPALTIATLEGFTVQTTFGLSGADALILANEGATFQVTWYVQNLAAREAALLKTCKGQLLENKLEYTITSDILRLASGLYRLTTVVTFPTIRNLLAHGEGPVFRVN